MDSKEVDKTDREDQIRFFYKYYGRKCPLFIKFKTLKYKVRKNERKNNR